MKVYGRNSKKTADRIDEYSGKDSKSNILKHSYQDNDKMCPETVSKFLEMGVGR